MGENDSIEIVKKERSKLSLFAFILGIVGLLIMFGSAGSVMGNNQSAAEEIGSTIGIIIVLPSIIAMLVAVILNGVGYFMVHRGLTLASAIIYAVSLLLMPMWGFVAIPSIILQFIAFAKMKPKH